MATEKTNKKSEANVEDVPLPDEVGQSVPEAPATFAPLPSHDDLNPAFAAPTEK